MTGQAGQFQPSGQSSRPTGLGALGSLRIHRVGWLLLAMGLLVMPFNRSGLWDPQELRLAELGRRLSHQLFGSNAALFATERWAEVTKSQIGQGELAATSPALGFALFGVSDWAGRITSLAWGTIAIVCLWLLMGRLAGRMAQAIAVLSLASLPLFAWQSRTMLGDAATIGTLAMATTGLTLAHLEGQEPIERRSLARLLAYWLLGLIGVSAGVLCRGILIGVCVPCLSMGLVGLAQRRAERRASRWSRIPDMLLIGLGLSAGAIGIKELQTAPAGYSFWLGATLTAIPQSSPFATAWTTVMHQVFPLSAFLPLGVAIALKRPARADAESHREQTVSLVLVFTLLLSLVACGVSLSRGVFMPYPALMAVAGISGVALERFHRQNDVSPAVVSATTLTVAVLLFADFVNLPDTVMLTTGTKNARLPESFNAISHVWLAVATAVLGLGCLLVALSTRRVPLQSRSIQASYIGLFERIRTAYGGQLLSGFVLVETALGTTALLQRAHDRGWISVPAFDAIRTIAGSLLAWAWLVPPLVLFVAPLGFTTLQLGVDWLLTKGRGNSRFGRGRTARFRALLNRAMPGWSTARLSAARLSAAVVLAATLVSSGFIVSLGHAPALGERVSPKRAVKEYQAHASAGEPLALLGLKPDSVRFYLGAMPETFNDIEAAARWLEDCRAERRWLTFGTERLAELNAAYRSVSLGRNLAMVESISGNTLLATCRLRGGERDYNPLGTEILTQTPTLAHRTAIEFGNVLRLVGWDVRSPMGESVSRLTRGQAYELWFVFEVLGTTAIDWQVFVHLDGQGRRHNGDHEPVAGRYPTSLWQPADIVVDRHRMVLERGALAGPHVLYLGLFRGSKRLEVTAGKHEDNRVMLGELGVR